ncbi:Pls/PosA family non-ribosomal peptide synthetase [Patulibacter minatonensis]|uniref:Pls/PosA family non-ribosomal peptide synthetase n=1 Tax=Patulibacter minatonensis TaxID=298163 RepID=UPI0004BAFC84|nr:Pls/PosA family non-ribosomal peptide synthetase [Patulibacter minatonensis]
MSSIDVRVPPPATPVTVPRGPLRDRPGGPGRTLLDVLDATVDRHPDRVAIDTGERTRTYRELAADVAAFAARLREEHVGPGDRVGVRMRSGTAELYVAILGILRAGAAYVPVDADDPDERARTVWSAAGVCAVVGDPPGDAAARPGTGSAPTNAAAWPPDGAVAIAPTAGGLLSVDAALRAVPARTGPPPPGPAITPLLPAVGDPASGPAPDDDAWVIFTSGSTGAPKGVAVSHRSAAAFVDAETDLWTVRPHDRVLAGLSVAFDASCEEMWLAWRSGAALVPAPRSLVRSGTDLGPWLVERGISVVSTVPTLAAMWDDDVLAGVRLLILGGEALPDDLAARLAADREVWNTYGPTEATVVSTATRVAPGRPVTIGAPLRGWDVAVVDEDGLPVPDGDAGELAIGGVGLARYLDPALDAERYAPLPALGWDRAYRSGDLVRASPDGLVFLGRRDDQVKIGGRRLELGEVEAHLAAAPGVRAAAAVVQRTPAGDPLLVGYVTGDPDPDVVREHVAGALSGGIAPLVVVLPELPVRTSGKVDRRALPWPPPHTAAPPDVALDRTAGWLAERWAEQLGPVAIGPDTDFFGAGGSSLSAARLVSVLRARFPTVAVADVYAHRTLGAFADRLDALGEAHEAPPAVLRRAPRSWGIVQVVGVLVLLLIGASQWLVGGLAYDDVVGEGLPHLSWVWVIGAWLALSSPLGRGAVVVFAERVLARGLRPGTFDRHSWLATRLWFVSRLAEACHVDRFAGTPWAGRWARVLRQDVGVGARLGTVPPPGSLVTIGAGATLESDVDLQGWWIDGDRLEIGRIVIGDGARIGARALLMPGATVGDGAEVEPGAVVTGDVPAGERWAGSPARYVGRAGEGWPAEDPPRPAHRRLWRGMFVLGTVVQALLPLVAFVPAGLVLWALGAPAPTLHTGVLEVALEVVALTVVFLCSYALLVAGVVRLAGRAIRPGWQADEGATGWALWFTEGVLSTARVLLFPLFASLYTRSWLRLMGIPVGTRTEISTAVGLSRLTRFGDHAFAADDVVLSCGRARSGWLHVEPIDVGSRTFLGNGAMLGPGTVTGDGSLVGVLTTAPLSSPDGTSWLGAPAIELPRVAEATDPARTTAPPRRLLAGRAVMDLLRLLVPSMVSVGLGWAGLLALDAVGRHAGLVWMAVAAAPILLVCGVVAVALTVAAKWLLMGRYAPGDHPLWSFFVWRDEFVNSAQEQLAGAWLMSSAIGTPLMSVYLRLLGARVGRGVWCETMALTEFDLVDLGDGSVVNRRACVETHLFHDRVMKIGPSTLGRGSTIGPGSAVLPDTTIGDGTTIGGRSVVLRGEELPAGTRWHGAPVVGA